MAGSEELVGIILSDELVSVVDGLPVYIPGPGVPPGGNTNQVLAKASNASYDTHWVSGGGGGGSVESVNDVLPDVDGNVEITTANIADSANKRYVTNAQLVVIGNTSGVNTGDQDLAPYELLANKATNLTSPDNTKYPTTLAVQNAIDSIPPGGVTSFNGRTGAVSPANDDYLTSQVGEFGRLYFTNARAIAAPLTGYVSGAGTVADSDSLLQAIQKLNGNTDLRELLANKATDLSSPDNTKYPTTLAVSTAIAATSSSVETLTNKTIDADLNTITNIENADIKAGAAIDASKIGDGSVSTVEYQYINSLSSNAQTQIDSKAPIASPTFTGVPAAPTASPGTNTAQVATTAFVTAFGSGYLPLSGVTYTSTTGTGLSLLDPTLTTGKIVSLVSTGTAAGAAQSLLDILSSGTSATTGLTTYGMTVSNTKVGGASSINVAGYFNASGSATNYSILTTGRVVVANGNLLNSGTNDLSLVTNSALHCSTGGGGSGNRLVMCDGGGDAEMRMPVTFKFKFSFGAVNGALTTQATIGTSGLGVGIGNAASSARIHALSTTEQLRLAYDSTNYISTTVASTGATTIAAAGSAPRLNISNNVAINKTSSTYSLDVGGTTNNLTAFFQAVSPATITTVNIQAAAGNNSSNPVFQILNAAGSQVAYARHDGVVAGIYMQTVDNSAVALVSTSGATANYPVGINLGGTRIVGWGASSWFDAKDIGISRVSSGKLGVGNGSAADVSGILIAGQMGIGQTTPTAWLHIKAGTATASQAPLKFTSGTNLTTPENGAVEYDGSDLMVTTGGTRKFLDKILRGSATLDFPSTAAFSSADLTIAVTGAADGDVVSLGVPNASMSANSDFMAWVSAADTVTVRFNNYSALAIDPASGTFKVSVSK